MNSNEKFVQGFCSTIEELKDYIRSDYNSEFPTSIMAIWEKSGTGSIDNMGHGGMASSKILFNMPFSMFITLGSLERILTENQKVWYALPLYNDKRRRIGNLDSLFGIGKNHGQLPGYKIYKLYTKEEILRTEKIIENHLDYPLVIPLDNGSLRATLANLTVKSFSRGILRRLMSLLEKS